MGVWLKLKDLALQIAGACSVRDIRVGLRYSAVMLETGAVGVAFSFLARRTEEAPSQKEVLSLVGKKATDLIELFNSSSPAGSSLALATINALFNSPAKDYIRGDILSHIEIGPKDTVAMIGYFAPLVAPLEAKAKEVRIFEQVPVPEAGIHPAAEAFDWLPRCQVVLITATAIINNSIDLLLRSCVSCKQVAILGPSTPLVPEAFCGTPVTLLSGIVVKDGPQMLEIVSQGGGTRLFRQCSCKVNLKIK